MTINSVLQKDLAEMLQVLGLGDHARSQSPHEVFQECIAEVRRMKEREPKDIADRLRIARETLDDASNLLRRHYLAIPIGQEMHDAFEKSRATNIGHKTAQISG